jgi:hypothetical protein
LGLLAARPEALGLNRLRISDCGLAALVFFNPQSEIDLEVAMRNMHTTNWRLDRRINLSVLLQLMVLASMILASWVNLQRQLGSLHTTSPPCAKPKEFSRNSNYWPAKPLHEFRLGTIEKNKTDNAIVF